MKIAIVDYGAGNLPSVERALRGLGAETERATEPAQVAGAHAIVLPGVGHFGAFVAGLRERKLTEPLQAAHQSGTPILGICLGLQAMFASSEEAPCESGLQFFPEKVTALPTNVKSPHIGWNQLRRVRESRLLHGLPEDAYFYFAHSFAAPGSALATVAACDHGVSFAAVIEQENLFGVQFHPEKSGETGALVLRNFLESL
ncbi:MAG TPA: imidazole glycerol phosphate synthase subunit HisH [Candidatus Dormibacteraeota bacterium]|nr:imidazole glycerol phosphate synthase subunit HisH [Candidatus Dormibacteraeota bacterium]